MVQSQDTNLGMQNHRQFSFPPFSFPHNSVFHPCFIRVLRIVFCNHGLPIRLFRRLSHAGQPPAADAADHRPGRPGHSSGARTHRADYKDPDQAGGQVLEGDRYWVWPIAATPVQPPLGSLLIDQDGNAWTILSLTKKQTPQGVWTARGRNLAVAYGLNNVAQVWKATYARARQEKPWRPIAASLTESRRGSSPSTPGPKILEDAEWPKTTYHVILGMDIFAPEIPVEPASADYRLVDSAGRHFRITAVSQGRADRRPSGGRYAYSLSKAAKAAHATVAVLRSGANMKFASR